MQARPRLRSDQSGQTLVLVTLAMVALIAGVGFVVDGGNVFAEQRATQNSADSAARAGAVVLARKEGEISSPFTNAQWDEQVRNAVLNAGLVNKTSIERMEYTDWQGNPLGVLVGSGSVPATASGVRAVAQKTPGTYLIRVVGIDHWTVVQEATAVSGPSTGCPGTSDSCIVLPIAFPVTVFQCSNNNQSDPIEPPQVWAVGQEITLPICGGNPGSVGWIDWTPPNGGTDEVVEVVLNPPAVNIPLPSWKYITQTGGISAAPLENALNTYAGQIVQVPFFDSTCPDEPTNQTTGGCLNPGGTGQNQWYHITKFLSFRLASPKGAFINGNNETTCGLNATQCLKGTFVTFITEGTVGAPCDGPCPIGTTFSVQLIK